MPRANEKVCFIVGAGHSGSTVLGLVLGSHSRCFYAGEAGKTRYIDDPHKEDRKRFCKICGERCPVWQRFGSAEGEDVFERISAMTGKPVVIDSTKGLDWVRERLTELDATTSRAHLLFLQRDGRAVVNSRIRKYPDEDARGLILRWADQVRKTAELFDGFAGPKARLRYESFATSPEAETRRISTLLGLEYEPAMLEFSRRDHHPLGGNNGAQYLVARERGDGAKGPCAQLSERNRAYYASHEAGIKLDTRWRGELDARVAELFEELAGEVNASMRWESE